MFLGTIPSHFELPYVRHWNLSVGFSQSKLVILHRGYTHLYLKCLCQCYGPFGQNTLHIIAHFGESHRRSFSVASMSNMKCPVKVISVT